MIRQQGRHFSIADSRLWCGCDQHCSVLQPYRSDIPYKGLKYVAKVMAIGYGFTDGHKTSPDELAAIFNGMAINGLLTHSRILTGYIPSAQALGVVADRIRRMKTDNPSLIYLLDREFFYWCQYRERKKLTMPTAVMGDIGTGLYVSRDVVPIYREMLNMATIITPNQFEVE